MSFKKIVPPWTITLALLLTGCGGDDSVNTAVTPPGGAFSNMEFGNKEHEQTWFGVTPTQSFQSGLPAFSPEGGVNTVGVHANLTYVASQHVIWRGFINLKDLVGQAANSPIVERSTAHVIGLGAAYHF